MYIVLSGARLNLGDHLIGERCRALLQRHKPKEELITFDSAHPLQEILDVVHSSKGVIVMGGPGLRPRMYPDIYKLTPELEQLRVPVIMMGIGWKGAHGDLDTVNGYNFSKGSLDLLNYSSTTSKYLGCRDFFTWQVLQNNSIHNVIMTGCPAWYDLDSINAEYSAPYLIENVVFTPPANPLYKKQAVQLCEVIRKVFPRARLRAFFHHGFGERLAHSIPKAYTVQKHIYEELEGIGIEGVDVSGDVAQIAKYREVDLHIGYRVHAHIDCLSRRRTSILIHEDGRGAGVDDALGVPGITAWQRKMSPVKQNLVQRLRGIRNFYTDYEVNKQAPTLLANLLTREVASGFSSYYGIGRKIDNYYKAMVKFIEAI